MAAFDTTVPPKAVSAPAKAALGVYGPGSGMAAAWSLRTPDRARSTIDHHPRGISTGFALGRPVGVVGRVAQSVVTSCAKSVEVLAWFTI